jgi:hypothetical protein
MGALKKAGIPIMLTLSITSTVRGFPAIIGVVLLAGSMDAVEADSKGAKRLEPDPVEAYRDRTLEGWSLKVHRRLEDEHPYLYAKTHRELARQLLAIRRAIPAPALEALQRVPIWVEYNHPKHPCMCYHVSPDWLRANGMLEQKAGGVELANPATFLKWVKDQPWMVLHELAHAYHHQVLGHDHPGILNAYKEAGALGFYENVEHVNGATDRHYALRNEQEYFAEATEAYFGTNDFYPYRKEELMQRDPGAVRMVERLWGVTSSNTEAH